MAFNVLIVDDSHTTRAIIAKALRHGGVPLGEVFEAADGTEALALLEDSWVDIVFADLNMPNMSGVELVERMAAVDLLSSIPVVIVSTEGRQDRIDALMQRGIATYVRKPFSPEELAHAALGLLEGPIASIRADDLTDAFFQAIEGFAMLVAEPLDEIPPPPEQAVIARMAFRGPGGLGQVVVAVPEGACARVAEAAMGEEHVADGCDALMELLNVTCGRLVDSIEGAPYTLEGPSSANEKGDSAWREVQGLDVSLGFDVEGMPLVLGAAISGRG